MFNPSNYSETGLKNHIKLREKQIYKLKQELGQHESDQAMITALQSQHDKWQKKKRKRINPNESNHG